MNNDYDQVSSRIDEVLKECEIDDDFLFFNAENGKYSVNCSDFFEWGTAEHQEITKDNIDVFEESVREIKNTLGFKLFAARVRGQRPQNAAYQIIPKKYWKLFDECGSERKIELTNPHTIEDRSKGVEFEVWWMRYWIKLEVWWTKLLGMLAKLKGQW